jgi:hypothetical protein
MPEQRKSVAEQAQKTSKNTKSTADTLGKKAEQSKNR